ncbi:MAG: extracellular solute-binding protein [Chloroflexota bacterium]|nr:extracellular solute-binding protein [Chloroflexota bacterium]
MERELQQEGTGTRGSSRRTMMTRGIARGASLGGAGILLAACGQNGGGGPGSASGGAKKPATLQYWARYAGALGEVEEKSLPVFKSTFPHITVERAVITGSYDNLLEKVTTSFASGSAPDVFNMGSSGIASYAHPGNVLQLDSIPRLKKESEDFFAPPNDIGKYKGKLYGMSWYVDSRMTIYRKDLLAEVGAATDRKGLPKTWDQFRDVAKRLATWEGGQIARIGFDVPKTDAKLFMQLVAQQGKSIYNPDGTKVAFEGPEGQKALQLLVDLIHRDRVDSLQRPSLPSGVEPLATPYVAGRYGNSELIAAVRRATVDPDRLLVSDFTPEFTAKTTAASYLGGTWQMASKTTKDVDATVEWLAYTVSPEMALAIAEATTTVPTRKSLDKMAYLQSPLLRPFYESLPYGASVPAHPRHREIESKLIEMVGEATQQKKSVQQALVDAAAFANGLLASS